MTDLRDLDRRAADFVGYPNAPEWRECGVEDCEYGDTCLVPAYSSEPHYANLLIEDLRKRGVEWSLVCENAEDPYMIWNKTIPDIYGDTWMEAVTRFYIAIMEEQE